jgi:hypothetical protein
MKESRQWQKKLKVIVESTLFKKFKAANGHHSVKESITTRNGMPASKPICYD